MKQLLTVFLFLLVHTVIAQDYFQGKVLDSQSKEPLAFVNILFNGGSTGVGTDIDGKFKLPSAAKIKSLTFSYIGYEKLSLTLEEIKAKKGIIYLKKSSYDLEEVLILPGKNPADRIIELAIQNKDINNPEKSTAFFYESYNKVLVTGIKDSSLIYKEKDSVVSIDSFNLQTLTFLEDHHYFLMESVSERNHIPPDQNIETIKATRVSGFKRPFFTLLGTQLQSFSLYKNYIDIFGLLYLSPISKGSTSKYLFVLEDTLYQGNDTVFVMSYRPKRGKNFEGLKGSISINSNLYAVENFTAEPSDTSKLPVKIQQKYDFIAERQWFPVQLNINVLFEPLYEGVFSTVMDGKSYIRNVELKSKIDQEDYDNVSIKLTPEVEIKGEDYWNKNRQEPLSREEENTYQFLDSIGEKYKADRLIELSEQALKGNLSFGYIDFILDRFIDFNGFEGFRAGIGIESNDKLIKGLRVGGYGAYGFKDKRLKYGSHLRFDPESEIEFETKLSYSEDVIESSGIHFYRNKYDFISSGGVVQNLFVLQMDRSETHRIETSFKGLQHFHFTFFGSHQERTINSEYRFLDAQQGLEIKQYNLTTAGINLRFVFKEKYAEFLGQELPVVSKSPLVYLKYTRGFEGLVDEGYDFNRIDLSVSSRFVIKNFGETRFLVRGGYIDEVLPLTALYRLIGINDNNTISVASSYKFETAFPNEFYSDQYVNLFLRHNFGSLIFRSGSYNPEILLIHSMAIGRMKNDFQHLNNSFQTIEQGFFETGILIDNILKQEVLLKGYFFGFGLGGYYRYGPYRLPKTADNFALKFTTYFGF